MNTCPRCGRENPADSRSCNACGGELRHGGTVEKFVGDAVMAVSGRC